MDNKRLWNQTISSITGDTIKVKAKSFFWTNITCKEIFYKKYRNIISWGKYILQKMNKRGVQNKVRWGEENLQKLISGGGGYAYFEPKEYCSSVLNFTYLLSLNHDRGKSFFPFRNKILVFSYVTWDLFLGNFRTQLKQCTPGTKGSMSS